MVAIPDGSWVDDQTDGIEMRKALGALLVPGGPSVARPGRLPGPGAPLTVGPTSPATMAYKVNAGKAVTLRSSTYGPVLGVGPDGDVTVPAPAAPSSGSRWDLVYLLQRDPKAPANDSASGAVVDVVSGAPGSSPQKPTLPAGALLLGESLVPATVTAITSAMVTDKPVWTNARGGPLIVSGQAERDALTAYDTLTVYRQDTRQVETYQNGWQYVSGPALLRTLDYSTPGLYGPIAGAYAAAQQKSWGTRQKLQGAITHTTTDYQAGAGQEYPLMAVAAGTAPAAHQTFTVSCYGGTNGLTGWATVTVMSTGRVVFYPSIALAKGASVSLNGIEWDAGA